MPYVPARGDAVWLDFSPQSGHEQAGHRPAIVLTQSNFNSNKWAVCCPITNSVKGYPFEVLIPAGLLVSGAILVDQVKSQDWRSRNAKFICKLPPETVRAVFDMLALFLTP
ncbi:MAG TPA: type II toxin-antitoxin system PemK/MazF family toxin [Thermoanaerobaculia bacterium]|nr:type II toxin-antitoxin system PemK/MazF family toxin [Thermoanaerobaculia bacterium]